MDFSLAPNMLGKSRFSRRIRSVFDLFYQIT